MHSTRLFAIAAIAATTGCAADVSATVSPSAAASAAATSKGLTMVVEATVAGTNLRPRSDAAYYFVLAAPTPAGEGPLVNGPAPKQYPYPDPRAYLPFVRDEAAVLDRDYIQVPPSTWTHFWVLTEEAARPVVWEGRRNADGTVNERVRQLTAGTEWEIVGGKTWKLVLPVPRLDGGSPLFSTWTANLATAKRSTGDVIDRWGQVPNQKIEIGARLGEQPFYDTNPGPLNPTNVPFGVPAEDLDWRSATVRLVDLGNP